MVPLTSSCASAGTVNFTVAVASSPALSSPMVQSVPDAVPLVGLEIVRFSPVIVLPFSSVMTSPSSLTDAAGSSQSPAFLTVMV